MPVTKTKSGPTHKDSATSKLSKSKYVTKPEGRHPTTHTYGVGQAVKMLSKYGSGK